jgi:hypothetical protein
MAPKIPEIGQVMSAKVIKRFLAAICIITVFSSCAFRHTIPDELLTGESKSPPAFTYFGGPQPQLREWEHFNFYDNSVVLMKQYYPGVWVGDYAIRGAGMAMLLDEGSRIEHTTAHPQYYKIWLVIPTNSAPGAIIPLRSADSTRRITHRGNTCNWGFMKPGELSLAGMQGYDIPECRYQGRQLGTIRVLERTTETVTIHLQVSIPVRLVMESYTLKVDRKYVLQSKDPFEEITRLLSLAPPATQDKWLKLVDEENRHLILERLGRQPGGRTQDGNQSK